MAFQNILVPTDFTEPSYRALRLACQMARPIGAHVAILHVGVDAGSQSDIAMAGASGAVYANLSARIEAEQRATLERISTQEIPEGVPSSTHLRYGDPATCVLERLQTGDHDLVVMGTHGRKGLARVLLGSVAEKVLRDSPVPVLLTR
ncbi:MAG: universal stress protein [Myxococcota bacterium]